MLNTPLDAVRFVVVDVETTGGRASENRMTEIAMCVVEDESIVARYSSLINPHQPIPDFIQLMTGITQKMVESAPDEDVALPPVVAQLQSESQPVVFVAHNVSFDWSFVSSAIQRMGEAVPDVPRICTCRLSRRMSTGLAKHNLGAVAEHYGITISARHRAMGDTEATALALIKLIERAKQEHDAQTLADLVALQHAQRAAAPTKTESKVRQLLAPRLAELPDEPGVYTFLNTRKEVLYIGKAKSLRDRVRQYFSDGPLHGVSVRKMIRYIRHIEWETTGTELGAMLLESRAIKTTRPVHNRAGREYHPPAFVKITNEAFPRIVRSSTIEEDGAEYFGPFRSARMADRLCAMVNAEYQLRSCEGALQPHAEARPCFEFHVKKCLGPCALHQTIDHYRESVRDARNFLMNVESGAVHQLAQQMESAAEHLDYERAALLRDGIRAIERVTIHAEDRPLAVTDTNLVIVVPTSDRYSTVEVYALRGGRLAFQRIVGTRANHSDIAAELEEVFRSTSRQGAFTDRELDELQIITSWLYKRRERSTTFVVRNHTDIAEEFAAALRTYQRTVAKDLAPRSEYSQLPENDDY